MTDKNDKDPEDNPFGDIFGMFFGPNGQFGGAFGPQGGAGASGTPGGQGGGLPFDPSMLGGLLSQLQGMMAGGGAEATAKQSATRTIPTPDPAVNDDVRRATTDAFRLAELWLEAVTDVSPGNGEPVALSRRDWVERSLPGWQELVDPVRANMNGAMNENMAAQMPEELRPMLQGASQMFAAMGDSMFGMQLGEALGALSGSVLGGTDTGLPLLGTTPALVEANVTGAAAEMGVETTELRIYLAVRELAHLWLYARSPWLAGHVTTALAKYAAGVEIDMSRIQDLTANLDPSNLEKLSEDIRSGLLAPQPTEAQEQAKETLTNVLSVVEGWVDVVTHAACSGLTHRDEIREALRNRLVVESEADRTFAGLLGIQLRPTRLRDAAALFTYLERSEGAEARDAVFTHPDLLPTTADLDDPLGYRERRTQDWSTDTDLDEALSRILAEGLSDGTSSTEGSDTTAEGSDTTAEGSDTTADDSSEDGDDPGRPDDRDR
ncbi:zinc-dependent metalloprotease [Brevibacterium samyangense]|uniref:Hydrolase n=1 Tax=Brevibacterium samyangense TaxID=366888 RepID=A0ABN2T9B3_9MICO